MRVRDRLDEISKLLSFDPILENGKDTCAAWDYVAQQLIPSNGSVKIPREIFAEECLQAAYEPEIHKNSKMISVLLCRIATRCMGSEWVDAWLDKNYYELVNEKTKSSLIKRIRVSRYFS
jgi:hypothetical protein